MTIDIEGLHLQDPRIIDYEDNGDGTFGLWLDTLVWDGEKTINARFHIFRLRQKSESEVSMEPFNGNLYEVLLSEYEF